MSIHDDQSDPGTPTAAERQRLYEATYESKSEDDIRLAYRRWAPTYEMHIVDQGWQAPELCVGLLAAHLPNRDAAVLDVGAGTGLVGKALRDLGFARVDAFDLSPEMLEQARAKQVYRRLHLGNAERLDGIKDASYDAVICVGALNFGHIAPVAYEAFIRVTAPDGLIAFTTREDYFQQASRAAQDALTAAGQWRLVEAREVTNAVKDMPHRHFCYQVCRA